MGKMQIRQRLSIVLAPHFSRCIRQFLENQYPFFRRREGHDHKLGLAMHNPIDQVIRLSFYESASWPIIDRMFRIVPSKAYGNGPA